jgi:hypothetical protein
LVSAYPPAGGHRTIFFYTTPTFEQGVQK